MFRMGQKYLNSQINLLFNFLIQKYFFHDNPTWNINYSGVGISRKYSRVHAHGKMYQAKTNKNKKNGIGINQFGIELELINLMWN